MSTTKTNSKQKQKKRSRRASFELNSKEKKVLKAFPRTVGTEITIGELAKKCFAKKGTAPDTMGNSWIRNSLRKLLRLKLVSSAGHKSGKYSRTDLRASDVLNDAVDRGLCEGPKVPVKPKGEEGDDEGEGETDVNEPAA